MIKYGFMQANDTILIFWTTYIELWWETLSFFCSLLRFIQTLELGEFDIHACSAVQTWKKVRTLSVVTFRIAELLCLRY